MPCSVMTVLNIQFNGYLLHNLMWRGAGACNSQREVHCVSHAIRKRFDSQGGLIPSFKLQPAGFKKGVCY